MRHQMLPRTDSLDLSKKLKQFYQSQTQLIEDFESTSLLVTGERDLDDEDEAERHKTRVAIATKMSLGANIVLLIIKLAVSVTSGSLAVLASAFDSLLDLLSGVILALVAYAMGKRDPFQYPQGKTRMEPLGLIVLASLMAMVSINVIVEAIRRLAAMGTPTVLTLLDIVLLCAVVATKAFLYIYCRTIRSPSVAALAQDHRNDVLTNIFGGISAWLAIWVWWLDPLGAMLFSIYVVVSWTSTGWDNIKIIVGNSAPPQFLQQLTFIALHHDQRVQQVGAVYEVHVAWCVVVCGGVVCGPDHSCLGGHGASFPLR
mmetsp:Transcript_42315/g.91989  ORF Transcript_42315/g.91989 Transcript_42315/m.91989 type:complete len:315 (+) Transcript_42315:408-1352(+)